MLVGNIFRVAFILYVCRDKVHRTGAVEGDYSGDIFNALRLKPFHE